MMKKLDILIICVYSFGLLTFWLNIYVFYGFFYSFQLIFWNRYIEIRKDLTKKQTAKILYKILEKCENQESLIKS